MEFLLLILLHVSDSPMNFLILYICMYMQWAHFPHIHFGLKLDGSKQAKLDQGEGTQKSNGFHWYINGSLWVSACFFYAWPKYVKNEVDQISQPYNWMGYSRANYLSLSPMLYIVYVFPFPIVVMMKWLLFLWLHLLCWTWALK